MYWIGLGVPKQRDYVCRLDSVISRPCLLYSVHYYLSTSNVGCTFLWSRMYLFLRTGGRYSCEPVMLLLSWGSIERFQRFQFRFVDAQTRFPANLDSHSSLRDGLTISPKSRGSTVIREGGTLRHESGAALRKWPCRRSNKEPVRFPWNQFRLFSQALVWSNTCVCACVCAAGTRVCSAALFCRLSTFPTRPPCQGFVRLLIKTKPPSFCRASNLFSILPPTGACNVMLRLWGFGDALSWGWR